MTTNYHTPIATKAAANSAIINGPMSQLDSAIGTAVQDIADIKSGTDAINLLNFGANATLTISGGSVARTQTRHLIDTEAVASLDDLDNITGANNGDVIIIRPVVSTRIVRVRHQGGGTGNIRNASGVDIYLNSTSQQLIYIYDGIQGLWIQFVTGISAKSELIATASHAEGLTFPPKIILTNDAYNQSNGNIPRVNVAPRMSTRGHFAEQAQNATYTQSLVAAGTNSGAGALSALTGAQAPDDVYTNQAIAAVAGTFGGRKSTTFNQFRRQHNPYFYAKLMLRTDLTNIRLWVGITQAQVTNVDTLAAGTAGCFFRYSTVAPDASFVALCNDGTNQSAAVSTGVTPLLDTDWEFEIQVDSTNGVVYFTLNHVVQVSVNTNLPATTQDLGYTVSLITTTATAKNIAISRIYGEYAA